MSVFWHSFFFDFNVVGKLRLHFKVCRERKDCAIIMRIPKRVIAALLGIVLAASQVVVPGQGKRASAQESFQDLDQSQITEVMGAGWNLGNQLEASNGGTPYETAYGNPVINEQLIKAVKKAGFRSIRIPVSYLSKIGSAPDYVIDSTWLDRVQQVVDMCMENGLYAIINMHGDGYTSVIGGWLFCGNDDSEQEQIKEKYKACWAQIADRFKSYDEHLIFESMNEEFNGEYGNPDSKAYANINSYNQIFVDTVRQSGGNNDKRWLLIPGWNTNIDYTAGNYGFELPTDSYRSAEIPADQQRLMISVHYYDPWNFCGKEDGKATQWGSVSTDSSKQAGWGDESYLKSQFEKLREKFVKKGYPVVIGEYGSIDKSKYDSLNAACRAEYARKVCSYAKADGLIPVYWDNGWNGEYGFGIFDRNNYQVTQQGIINAIMESYGSGMPSEEPESTSSVPVTSPGAATDVPASDRIKEILYENGAAGDSYETSDTSWLAEGKATDTLTVVYSCTEADHAGWGILGWGASVDGEWKEGVTYSAGNPASTEMSKTYTLAELRNALGIESGSTVSYLKLSAYNGGKIHKIYLEKDKPQATQKPSQTPEITTKPEKSEAPLQTPEVTFGPGGEETPPSQAPSEKPSEAPEATVQPEESMLPETSTEPSAGPEESKRPESPKPDVVPSAVPGVSAGPVESINPGTTSGAGGVPETSNAPVNNPQRTGNPEVTQSPDNSPVPGNTIIKYQEKTKKLFVTQKYLIAGKIAAEKDVVSWQSSNKKVAKVNGGGMVTALKKGKTVITAKCADGTIIAQKLQVTNPKVVLKKTKIIIKKGKKAKIKIKTKISTDKIKKYRVKNKKIIRITSKGRITGLKKGKTYVTVIMKSGVKKKCRIVVKG